MAQWSAAEKKAYRKALKGGLVPGSLVPRGYAGRFSADGARGSRRSGGGGAIQERCGDEWFGSDDVYDIKRGIRRLEHRLEDLTEEMDRAASRGLRPVTRWHPPHDRACLPGSRETPGIRQKFETPYVDDPDLEEVRDADFEDVCHSDPCQAEILDKINQLGEVCQGSIDQLERYGGLARNGRAGLTRNDASRRMMYNRPRTLGQRFDNVLGYLKEHPIIAIVGLGAVALIAFALYKMVRTILSNVASGAEISHGVMRFPGSDPYLITQDDALWLIRAIWGEVNRSNDGWETAAVQSGAAAVMWALANNYMTVGQKRRLYPTFGQYIQAYCQPINPIWSSAGASGCQRNPSACTADRLAFRQALRSKPWAQFPPGAQALVTTFVAGGLRNPIGRRTDWAAAGEGRVTADAVNVAGNVFITDPSARSRTAAA